MNQSIVEPGLLTEYHSFLNEEERRQQGRFHFKKHRHQYLLTRALVRSTLSLYVNTIKPDQWEFSKNRYGKPSIKNSIHFPLQFNLSHTDEMIVLAVTLGREIGVDVEWVGRKGQTVEIAERFFSPPEIEQLQALPAARQRDRFFDLWTLKEAYIKACGMGLAIPLDQVTFYFHQDKKFTVTFDSPANKLPNNFIFSQIVPNKSHKVALAIRDHQILAPNETWSLSFMETVPLQKINEIDLPYFLSFVN